MCMKRFMLRFYVCMETLGKFVVVILRSKNASAKLPDSIFDDLARCFLPDILAFLQTENGQNQYEEWKIRQEQIKAQKAIEKA